MANMNMFNNLLIDSQTISRATRNNVIISIIYITFFYSLFGLNFLFKDARGLDVVEKGIAHALYIIAKVYVYAFLVQYFKENDLKRLVNTTLVIIVAESISSIVSLINSFKLIIPSGITGLANTVFTIGIVVQIILILKLPLKKYFAINSLRRYVYGLIAAFALGIGIVMFTFFKGFSEYTNTIFIVMIIPNIFIVDFVLKFGTTDHES